MGSPAAPPTMRLGLPTFASLATLDLVVYFDWALRWEPSGAFFQRGSWLGWTAASLSSWLLVTAWLVYDGAGFVRHALPTFVAFSFGAFIAGTGNARYDWLRLPFDAGLYQSSNIGVYTGDGVFSSAVVTAVAHGLLGRARATHLGHPSAWSLARWLAAAGVGFLGVGVSLGQRIVSAVVTARSPTAVTGVRALTAFVVPSIGVVFLVLGVASFLRTWRALRRSSGTEERA